MDSTLNFVESACTEDALDSFDSDFASDQDFFETLEQADVQAEEAGDKAFDSWVVERLNFVRREAKPGGFRYFHDYRHPTLVPLHEVVTNFPTLHRSRSRFSLDQNTTGLPPHDFQQSDFRKARDWTRSYR